MQNGDIDDIDARSMAIKDISEKYLPTNLKYKFNDTIANLSTLDSRVRKWALVPSKRNACSYCLLLASQGYVYNKTAWKPHDNCDCRLVPYNESVRPTGYNPEKMQPQMSKVRDTLSMIFDDIRRRVYGLSGNEFVAEFGKISPSEAIKKLETSEICAEMRTRSIDWLVDGVEPKVTFESTQVRRRATERELNSAEKLKKQGISCKFIKDYEQVGNKTIGKPDLKNGWEIKTPHSATSQNTINKYVKNARDKRGIKVLVLDNSDNSLKDNEMVKMLVKAREAKHFEHPIYMINKKNSLVRLA